MFFHDVIVDPSRIIPIELSPLDTIEYGTFLQIRPGSPPEE